MANEVLDAEGKEEEEDFLKRYDRLRQAHPEVANGAYHIDIPFSVETQRELFSAAGFVRTQVIWKSGQAAVFVVKLGERRSR